MLHAIELENFKAFGKRARIPFAPITLIFGENSAGKSTILQALNLLKQTLESQEPGPLVITKSDNSIVDLGSFPELVFDHDLERTITIRVEIAIDKMGKLVVDAYLKPPIEVETLPPLHVNNEIGIELSFKRPKKEVILDQIGIYDGQSSKCIAKLQMLGEIRNMTVALAGYSHQPLTATRYIWLTQEPEYWEPGFRYHKEHREVILGFLKSRLHNLLKDPSERELSFPLNDSLEGLHDFIEFFDSDFDLETYISKMYKENMSCSVDVLRFLPIFGLSGSDSVLGGTTGSNKSVMIAGGALQKILEKLFPMGPFRKSPERLYTFSGTTPQHVGYQGDLLPDFLLRHPERVAETNKWLKQLDIGYKLEVKEVKSVDAYSSDLFEVRLMDIRRREPVSVAWKDVGYGVSQILPFVVQSLVSGEQIISIEQPEVHVHPRLQADLGDLLAEAIQKHQKQFIIETHSEHLILRLQRLVRKKEIAPEDVSVIYVSRRPEGAKAERLHLDEDGDFIDDWPNGFFTERLREL